jgi:hypothetical protein
MDVLTDGIAEATGAERRGVAAPGRRARIAWLATVAAAAACLLIEPGGGEDLGPRFNHALHGEEAGLECASCHLGAGTADLAGMPVLRQCQLCHAGMDEEKPPKLQAAWFFDEQGVRSAGVTLQSDEIVFSHRLHVADHGLDCADCHGDVASSTAIPADARVTMAECMDCHSRAERPNDCAECHREIRSDRAPADHAHGWTRRHGQVVLAGGGADAASCTPCHVGERDCNSCHRDEAPADHTGFWKERGHGIAVRVSRDRCATCHQSDSCDRCHRESAPRSHLGSFGSPQNRHCITCHEPLFGEGCFTCHKSAPSHTFAAPLPADHSPGMNCRQCHGLSAPLPHPDKGDSCIACHR